jgi:hypothetical protein
LIGLAAFAAVVSLAAFAAGAGLKDNDLVDQVGRGKRLPYGRTAFDEQACGAAGGERAQHIGNIEATLPKGRGDHLRARGF